MTRKLYLVTGSFNSVCYHHGKREVLFLSNASENRLYALAESSKRYNHGTVILVKGK